MEDFKDLRVWAKAHELTLAVYQKTRAFPREEIYGLTSQLRRASASIGAMKVLEMQRMLASLVQSLKVPVLASSQ